MKCALSNVIAPARFVTLRLRNVESFFRRSARLARSVGIPRRTAFHLIVTTFLAVVAATSISGGFGSSGGGEPTIGDACLLRTARVREWGGGECRCRSGISSRAEGNRHRCQRTGGCSVPELAIGVVPPALRATCPHPCAGVIPSCGDIVRLFERWSGGCRGVSLCFAVVADLSLVGSSPAHHLAVARPRGTGVTGASRDTSCVRSYDADVDRGRRTDSATIAESSFNIVSPTDSLPSAESST